MSEPANHRLSVGDYRSFLVRLWQSHAEGSWHASVQSIQTGTTFHFADLLALYAFLDAQASATPGPAACSTDEIAPSSW